MTDLDRRYTNAQLYDWMMGGDILEALAMVYPHEIQDPELAKLWGDVQAAHGEVASYLRHKVGAP